MEQPEKLQIDHAYWFHIMSIAASNSKGGVEKRHLSQLW